MAIYPSNQTTPAKGSGNYLWNWLGSSLKKFGAAISPYVTGGGGGDGYTYTEVNISSTQILNDLYSGSIPLLPDTSPGQYYYIDKMILEFTPGTTPYALDAPSDLLYVNGVNLIAEATILSSPVTTYAICNSYTTYVYPTYAASGGWQLSPNQSSVNLGLEGGGPPTLGDGTLKAKIWYKTVNFG